VPPAGLILQVNNGEFGVLEISKLYVAVPHLFKVPASI